MNRRAFLTVLPALAPVPFAWAKAGPDQSAAMAELANAFLASLSGEQRAKASIPFDSEERQNWHYIPKARKGIALKELDEAQKRAGFALLDSGLSEEGGQKARLIIELEGVLAVIENNPVVRDMGLYYLSIFGKPGDAKGWGWRFEGHHLSINITHVGDRWSATPAFWGANPAEVREEGALKGARALSQEEDLARKLAQALHAEGKPVVTEPEAPREYYTRAQTRVSALEEPGVAYADMGEAQRQALRDLLGVYAANFADAIGKQELDRIAQAGWEKVQFSWKGGLEPGAKHYYLLQGPTFLLEYVNYQNDANHIHTAWRSFDGDYGLDALS